MADPNPVHISMKDLLSQLIREKMLFSQKVYNSMMEVDRADFAPSRPYQNNAQRIGCNVVISAPDLHSYCLEALKDHLTEGSTVLDVGFGSGYLTAAMSKMMNDKGTVIGIEHIKELYDFGLNNICKHHKNLIDSKKIILVLGDGRLGYKNRAPYRCIHIGAASTSSNTPKFSGIGIHSIQYYVYNYSGMNFIQLFLFTISLKMNYFLIRSLIILYFKLMNNII